MSEKKDRKVFRSQQEIMDYYDMSRPAFKDYIQMGMPARKINGKWHAHANNIDRWFEKMTAFKASGDVQEE